MSYKQTLYNIQSILFNIFIFFSYLLLFVSALGISEHALLYLNNVSYYVRIYICIFLIWRFNPLRDHYEFTDLDRRISFSAGLFILSTTFLQKYIDNAKEKAHQIFKNEDGTSIFN